MTLRTRTTVPWTEALETVLAACAALPPEEVPLAEAHGRVLAGDAHAPDPVPPFANSAMDGYAVRAADLGDAGGRLPLVSAVPAGTAPPPLPAGRAAPIATGAPVPEGADTVVPVEDTERDGDGVVLPGGVEPGRHVRLAGSDTPAGAVLIRAGTPLGPAEGAILAGAGLVRVGVHRCARVAVVSTGSELVPAHETPGPAQIRESNSLAVSWACRDAGADVRVLGIARDDPDEVRALLARGLDETDVLISSAGVSVGERDLVRGALEGLGVATRVEAVAIRPGKPLIFGVRGETLVFGLPGNPASAQVGVALFVRPALRALAGVPQPRPLLLPAVAAGAWPPPAERDHAVRCRLGVEDGALVAVPTGDQGSHRMASMVGADALAIVPAGSRPGPGDPVSVVRLSG
jgi:molybdopterin molybdotransferase